MKKLLEAGGAMDSSYFAHASSYFFIPKLLDFSSIEKWSLLALLLGGVLQQLVNCFLEASGGSLTFSHRLVISSQKSAWVELKTNLKHRECVFFHFGVCWNSSSTAS